MGYIEIICTLIGAVAAILSGVWFIVNRAQKRAVNDYRLENMEPDVAGLKTNVQVLKTDVAVLKTDVQALKTDVAGLKTDVQALKTDVAGLKAEVSDMKQEMTGFRSDMSELKEDMATVKAVLVQKFPNVIIRMAMKKSPRQLNDTGQWVFRQVNGDKFLEEHRDFFFRKIDAMKPKTAYDVEQAANIATAGYTDNDMFNDIKLYVYNAPAIKIKDDDGRERDYEISLGDVCYALSLPLRDMYLEAHPEIPR